MRDESPVKRRRGLFRTAFAVTDEVDAEPAAEAEGSPSPFELLTQALDGLVDAGRLTASPSAPRRRPRRARAAD